MAGVALTRRLPSKASSWYRLKRRVPNSHLLPHHPTSLLSAKSAPSRCFAPPPQRLTRLVYPSTAITSVPTPPLYTPRAIAICSSEGEEERPPHHGRSSNTKSSNLFRYVTTMTKVSPHTDSTFSFTPFDVTDVRIISRSRHFDRR